MAKLNRTPTDMIEDRVSGEKLSETLQTIGQDVSSLNAQLAVKVTKGTLTSADLDTSSDGSKIKLINLSDEVKQAMAGTTPIYATFGKGSVVKESVAKSAIRSYHANFLITGKNLFNKDTVSALGTWINYTNGNVETYPTNQYIQNYRYSDFIPVLPNTSYKANAGINSYVFYDNTYKYISGATPSSQVITTTANASFVILNFSNTDISTFQLELGTTSTAYESFVLDVANLKANKDVSAANTNISSISAAIDKYKVNNVAIKTGDFSSDRAQSSTFKGWVYPFLKASLTDKLCGVNMYVCIGTAVNVPAKFLILNNNKVVIKEFAVTIPKTGFIQAYFTTDLSELTDTFFVGITTTDGTILVPPNSVSNPSYNSGGVKHAYTENSGTTWSDVSNTTLYQGVVQLLGSPSYIFGSSSPITQTAELILSPKIYGVVGKEINIYFDNLVSDNGSDYLVDVICDYGSHYEKRWTYVPDAARSFPITISVYDKNLTLIKSVSSTVIIADTATNTGVTKKCLFIGDSTTQAGKYTGELLNLMNSDPMDVTLIGTQGTPPNLHEGYGGKTVAWHYSDPTSPFVFSGAFNFSQYMNTKGFTSVDVVAIHLGINDVFALTSDTQVDSLISGNLTALNAMIASIKAFNANVKIGIMVTIPPSKSQDAFGYNYGSGQNKWRYKRNIHRYCKALIDNYSNKESSDNIYLVPVNVNLDTENNMVSYAVALNSRNTTTYQRQSNAVHPEDNGYYQIADVVYYWLKNII